MSALELSEATRRRLPYIKKGLLDGKTAEEIGVICQVTAKTIERDKRSWRQSGLLEDWVREEGIRLHYIIVQEKPLEAYREIMRLLGKTLIQKIEKKIDERRIELKVYMWKSEDESAE